MGFQDDGHFKSVNTGRLWYKNHPFILSSQATKVFYVSDTRLRGNWRVVQKFTHRHLWSVKETETGMGPGGGGLTYQDENSEEVPVKENETHVQTRVRRDQQERVLVDAAVVEGIRKKIKVVVNAHESEDEDDDYDDTMYQYYEETSTGHGIPGFSVDDDE